MEQVKKILEKINIEYINCESCIEKIRKKLNEILARLQQFVKNEHGDYCYNKTF
jgi:copper chaperone CopZ